MNPQFTRLRLHRRAEFLANISIIVLAILLGAIAAKKYVLDRQQPLTTNQVVAGNKVSLTNVDWAQNTQTLLLALSTNCHFCSESAPFYQRLVEETAKQPATSLIAVFPQDVTEGRRYLDNLKIGVPEVRQASPNSIGVMGTPTLILIDRNGVVKNVWVGKLSPDKESEIIKQL